MWMEKFDLKDLGSDQNFGLNNSKCALAYKEKFSLIKTLFEIMEESGMSDDLSDDEFLRMFDEGSHEPKGRKSLGSQATLSSTSSRSGQKRKKPAGK